jgi:hypothetical protein
MSVLSLLHACSIGWKAGEQDSRKSSRQPALDELSHPERPVPAQIVQDHHLPRVQRGEGYLLGEGEDHVGVRRALDGDQRDEPGEPEAAQVREVFGTEGRIANPTLRECFDETAIGCFMDLVEAAKHDPGHMRHWVEFVGERPSDATDHEETTTVEAA